MVSKKSNPKKIKTPNSRLTKLSEKQTKRDRAYRAALGLGEEKLPNVLGAGEGHGGAQPQVARRRRATSVLPKKLAVSIKSKRSK